MRTFSQTHEVFLTSLAQLKELECVDPLHSDLHSMMVCRQLSTIAAKPPMEQAHSAPYLQEERFQEDLVRKPGVQQVLAAMPASAFFLGKDGVASCLESAFGSQRWNIAQ